MGCPGPATPSMPPVARARAAAVLAGAPLSLGMPASTPARAVTRSPVQALAALGVPVFPLYDASTAGADPAAPAEWGSAAVRVANRHKAELPLRFFSFGLDVTVMDADAMIIADPRPFYARFPDADVLLHADHTTSRLPPGDTGLELPDSARVNLSVGVLVLRNRPVVRSFFASWAADMAGGGGLWEQAVFNDLMVRGDLQLPANWTESRIVLAWRRRLRLGILPAPSFGSGHTAVVTKLQDRLHLPLVSVRVAGRARACGRKKGGKGIAGRSARTHTFVHPHAPCRLMPSGLDVNSPSSCRCHGRPLPPPSNPLLPPLPVHPARHLDDQGRAQQAAPPARGARVLRPARVLFRSLPVHGPGPRGRASGHG